MGFMISGYRDLQIARAVGVRIAVGQGRGLRCGADGSDGCADRPGDGSDDQRVNADSVGAVVVPGGQGGDGIRQQNGVGGVDRVPAADGGGVFRGQVEHAPGVDAGHGGGEGGLGRDGQIGFAACAVGVDAMHSNTPHV